jgi:hypothetical protein
MGDERALIPSEVIERRILVIRGHKVMLDTHLAELYGVDTKTLKRAVRRNRDRFPPDFMFELTAEEHRALRYQFGTLKRGEHIKYRPFVFSEQGVAMLSSVLRSKRAMVVNIEIMRVFVRLREVLANNRELAHKLADLERRFGKHDEQIQAIFDAIRQLMTPPETARKEIGFHMKEENAPYRIKRVRRKWRIA